MHNHRRGFLERMLAAAGLSVASSGAQVSEPTSALGTGELELPAYARAQRHRSLKQSSCDRTGGNHDFWSIPAGGVQEVFSANEPGAITHIWFTIAAQSPNHLKEIVLRAWWDGASKPSIETPVGDFFGLNVAEYVHYESAFLACSPGKSLNCYFRMPYRKSARLTVTNEGSRPVGAFYSNIDYEVGSVPADALYFHAQYRQGAPNIPTTGEQAKLNPDGKFNYVFAESHGRGNLMGVTLGVLLNADGWMGEGDDMIFVDDETKPAIIGTGSEDYFLGSWNFGGRDAATPFGHHFYGAPLIEMPERTGGRYCCYRWHGDNPVTFSRYLKHTIEHGHANDRGDNFYSVCYWYQDRPSEEFPALPPVAERILRVRT